MNTQDIRVTCPACGKDVIIKGNTCPVCECDFSDDDRTRIEAEYQKKLAIKKASRYRILIQPPFLIGAGVGLVALGVMEECYKYYKSNPNSPSSPYDIYGGVLCSVFIIVMVLKLMRPKTVVPFLQGILAGCLLKILISVCSALMTYLFVKLFDKIFPNGLIPH